MSVAKPQTETGTLRKPHRNIVVLFDGTGECFSAHNSNVIKMLSVLQADEDQLLYYSSGVGEYRQYRLEDIAQAAGGTVFAPGESLRGKIGHKVAVWTDEGFAW
jgi:uncharacterized protein (DUF2235 family)